MPAAVASSSAVASRPGSQPRDPASGASAHQIIPGPAANVVGNKRESRDSIDQAASVSGQIAPPVMHGALAVTLSMCLFAGMADV